MHSGWPEGRWQGEARSETAHRAEDWNSVSDWGKPETQPTGVGQDARRTEASRRLAYILKGGQS
jgi:hypothetical protein